MALPTSRDRTYAPGSLVYSADLNDIQDQIIALHGQTDTEDQSGAEALIVSPATHWQKSQNGFPGSVLKTDGSTPVAPAAWYCPRGQGVLLSLGIIGYCDAGSSLGLFEEAPSGSGGSSSLAAVLRDNLTSALAALAGGWAYTTITLSSPLTLGGGSRPFLQLTPGNADVQISLVRWVLRGAP
jgi:hypothetical protein